MSDAIPEHPELLPGLCRRMAESEGPEALATWSVARWRDHLAQEGIAPPIEFGGGEQGLRASAGHLAKTFSACYSTKALGALATARSPELGQAVADVDERPKRAAMVFGKLPSARKSKQVKELQQIESLHAMCRESEPVMRLLEAGVTSPRVIARMGLYGSSPPSSEMLLSAVSHTPPWPTRGQGECLLGLTRNVTLSNGGTTARGLPSPKLKGKQRERASEALGGREPAELDSTWEKLSGSFGRSGECAHCRSIFGPAAYLFDMLLFLAGFSGEPAHHAPSNSLLQTLMERRPDIPRLHLSCDNTNIEVPQIDLVNELLSDLIAASVPEPTRPNAPGTCGEEGKIMGPIERATPGAAACAGCGSG